MQLNQELAEKGKVRFYVRAVPGAAKTEVVELMEDQSVKIRIAAAPEGGKANAELVRFLAKEFGVGRSGVSIVSGEKTRIKLMEVKRRE